MKKFLHFLKALGIILLGGIAGGIIHLGLSYFFAAPKMGYILVGAGAAAFYWYFIKKYEKTFWDVPFGVFGVVLAVALTQFFDIMIFDATRLVGENVGILKRTFFIYHYNFFTVSNESMTDMLENGSVYQELILLSVFALIFAAITCLILWAVTKKADKKKETESGRTHKTGGSKQ